MYRIFDVVLLMVMLTTAASSSALDYRTPPSAIADIVEARLPPGLIVSPDQGWMVIMEQSGLPSIVELAREELRLAGVRIDPSNQSQSRAVFFTGLTLMDLTRKVERAVTGIPANARLRAVQWSPDSRRLTFELHLDNAIELWVVHRNTAHAERLTAGRLSGVFGSSCQWLSNSADLICRLGVNDVTDAPDGKRVPSGPDVQETTGSVAAVRTFQDLLTNAEDDALFEFHATSQVARVSVKDRKLAIGDPGLVLSATPSPDGSYVLVHRIERPFSRLVPFYRFPTNVEMWTSNGTFVREIASIPLAEDVPIGFDAVRKGPRYHQWQENADATLIWTEAMDGGDPKRESEVRDRVFSIRAPFDGKPKALADLDLRFNGVSWSDAGFGFVAARWWRDRRMKTWLVGDGDPKLLVDRSFEDRYNDPGLPVFRYDGRGRRVAVTSDEGRYFYLNGLGASPEGDRPFLDRFDRRTGKTTRLWRSIAPYFDRFIAFRDNRRFIMMREAPDEPANVFEHQLDGDGLEQLTHFPHPYPHMRGIEKEIISYEREDGTGLNARLYLPPGKTVDDGPFPTLVWAYPREFKDADFAAQMTGSPYQFKRIWYGGPLPLLAAGYAVLDGPTMPIVGEGKAEPNDRYVEQLVASARAAIDELVRRGVARRDAVAIGGHSYGAFMAANLLAHSDLFAAGIARSGAYNRSLTPFGFQAEERTFWEAPEVYFSMSPFMHADKINEPLLLIHGELDNNSGTFPIQSKRFYHALKGHGATARLTFLPFESHGYRARESVLHGLWEMHTWLQRFVRHRTD
jgi:dipeptidyl aminopeptidase/acylaminoacyl peptidase